MLAALVAEGGAGRVGVRLSPTAIDPLTGELHQMYFGAFSSDAQELYEHVVAGLNDMPLAYLLLTKPRVGALSVAAAADRSASQPLRNARFRALYRGTLIGAGGFAPRTAAAAVASGAYELIAFGRWFLANPDLPERLRAGSPLNVYDGATFYGSGARLHRLPGAVACGGSALRSVSADRAVARAVRPWGPGLRGVGDITDEPIGERHRRRPLGPST